MVIMLVVRLTRSLPLSRSYELPVYVARVPAAQFCETPILMVPLELLEKID